MFPKTFTAESTLPPLNWPPVAPVYTSADALADHVHPDKDSRYMVSKREDQGPGKQEGRHETCHSNCELFDDAQDAHRVVTAQGRDWSRCV